MTIISKGKYIVRCNHDDDPNDAGWEADYSVILSREMTVGELTHNMRKDYQPVIMIDSIYACAPPYDCEAFEGGEVLTRALGKLAGIEGEVIYKTSSKWYER